MKILKCWFYRVVHQIVITKSRKCEIIKFTKLLPKFPALLYQKKSSLSKAHPVFYCYVCYAILYISSDVAMIMFLVFYAPIQLFAYSFPILLVPWTFFYAVAIYFAIDIISEHTSNLLDGWNEKFMGEIISGEVA